MFKGRFQERVSNRDISIGFLPGPVSLLSLKLSFKLSIGCLLGTLQLTWELDKTLGMKTVSTSSWVNEAQTQYRPLEWDSESGPRAQVWNARRQQGGHLGVGG